MKKLLLSFMLVTSISLGGTTVGATGLSNDFVLDSNVDYPKTVEFGVVSGSQDGISAMSYSSMATGESFVYRATTYVHGLGSVLEYVGEGVTDPKSLLYSVSVKTVLDNKQGTVWQRVGEGDTDIKLGVDAVSTCLIYTPLTQGGTYKATSQHSVAYGANLYLAGTSATETW